MVTYKSVVATKRGDPMCSKLWNINKERDI